MICLKMDCRQSITSPKIAGFVGAYFEPPCMGVKNLASVKLHSKWSCATLAPPVFILFSEWLRRKGNFGWFSSRVGFPNLKIANLITKIYLRVSGNCQYKSLLIKKNYYSNNCLIYDFIWKQPKLQPCLTHQSLTVGEQSNGKSTLQSWKFFDLSALPTTPPQFRRSIDHWPTATDWTKSVWFEETVQGRLQSVVGVTHASIR